MEGLTQSFLSLLDSPEKITEPESTAVLERYVILIYNRTSAEVDVNIARKTMFSQRGKDISRIPPTKDALMLHASRAVFQASHIWNKSLSKQLGIPSPEDWGWVTDRGEGEELVPKWISLPPAVQSCSELIKCGCKKGCARNCRCKKAELPCTALCKCDGQCAI